MKAEKERKFKESLLKILYPPPPPLPTCHHQEDEEESPTDPSQLFDDLLEEDNCLSSNEDESCSSYEKLTRAQRKKIRRKKLKEAASQPRREIIGPLLPSISIGNGSIGEENKTQIQESEIADTKVKKNKRRMAKKLKKDTHKELEEKTNIKI